MNFSGIKESVARNGSENPEGTEREILVKNETLRACDSISQHLPGDNL